VTTRRELLVLLRTRPGSTVTALAGALSLTAVAVRRHLDELAADGLAERIPPVAGGIGRPASRWRLSSTGLELFPRRYDALALDLLEDLAAEAGPEAVDALFARRTDKLAAQYEVELGDVADLHARMERVAALRDDAGYAAECLPGADGEVLLVENNCAVHRVAEQHPVVCNMELSLLRRVLGPDAEVERVSHTMVGDAVCCYRVRARPSEDGSGQ
jgi:predicted ArsR family transcriptional regulator